MNPGWLWFASCSITVMIFGFNCRIHSRTIPMGGLLFGSDPRSRWSCMIEFTASASLGFTCSIHGFTSSSRCAATPRKANRTLTERANSASRKPISRSESRPSGDGGPMPVSRSRGGPPGRNAKAWIKAGHCRPCIRLKSMTCTQSWPSNASNMAWLAVKWANFRYGHAS